MAATTLDVWACAKAAETLPALRRLLGDDATADERNDLGETPLHVAAARGNDAAVQLLLRHGADLMAADWESGWTPLHRSLYHEHLSTSLLLLRHAQTRFGKKFLRRYLHDTRDFARQSPMQLLSTRLAGRAEAAALLEPTDAGATGGMVYTFGKRDYQLGYHLPNADVQVSPRLVTLSAASPIVQVSASKYHTIALNAAGECFVWGFGKGGRLGTGSEFDRIEPTKLTSLATTPMQKVAAGENHTLALSRTGQVFSWGSNSFGQLGHPGKSCSSQSRLTPKRVDAFKTHVVAEIAASGCHSAAIDAQNGVVYTWGSNRRGQLGRKEGCGTDQPDATPRSVDALRPRHPLSVVYGDYDVVRAEQLALSDWHTCVVLRCSRNGRSRGHVWQCGYGSYRPSRVSFGAASGMAMSGPGALLTDTWLPTCKQQGVDIVQVSCAQNHSIARSASGAVFTWGHNAPALSHQPKDGDGQEPKDRKMASPTLGPTASPTAPQKVALSSYGAVVSVCASQDHCAVVTQGGDLVTWGCGLQGVLGHGRGNTWQPSPKRVAGVKKAVAVAAGHQHTAVLVAPVHPEFPSTAYPREESAVPSLQELVERKIAAYVDVANCVTVWKYAEHYAARGLQSYCSAYMKNNWDAVLDVVGKDRLELLFELVLPPVEQEESESVSKPRVKATATPAGSSVVPERQPKERKVGKKQSASNANLHNEKPEKEASAAGNAALLSEEKLAVDSPLTPSKPSSRRKAGKFVPLTAFLSNKSGSKAPVRDSSSPWSVSTEAKPSTTHAKPTPAAPPASPGFSPMITSHSLPTEDFPLPTPSLRKGSVDLPQRKASIGSHPSASPRLTFSPVVASSGKHVLGYDGVEHEQVTAFSLDAFLKQPKSRRGARGKAEVSTAPTWSTPAVASADGLQSEQKAPAKTLKQIQQEEEAAAAREREAKARLSGGRASSQRAFSTVNSWGLCRTPGHVSLADVQKLQEEQAFLAQQREILAEIQRERALEQAMKTSAGGDASKKPANASKKKLKKKKPTTGGAGAELHPPAGEARGASSQAKQAKQKKAKERKAARKAAGETFATPHGPSNANTAASSSSTKSGGRKKGGRTKTAASAAAPSHRVGKAQSRPRTKSATASKATPAGEAA